MDIHDYEKKYKTAIRDIENAPISRRNKDLIMAFHDKLVLENLTLPRLMKYLSTLKLIAHALGKDLDQAKREDLQRFVAQIQRRQDYSSWTKHSYKVILRRFYVWLHRSQGYSETVDWISIRVPRSEMRLPSEDELLTESEIRILIDQARHPRDKALVSALWESGARVSEIGNLKFKHVAFDDHGILLTVRGKTGSRKVRLIFSVPYLSTWLNMHPGKNNPDSWIWINVGNTNHGQLMRYAAFRKTLQTLFHEAGIKKRYNPHRFRHSRATLMASHLTEFQMNQYFGWIQGSRMPAIYVHMNGKEVDNAILAMHGLVESKDANPTQLKPVRCPRCNTINDSQNRCCNQCGGLLDIKYAMEIEADRQRQEGRRKRSDDLMNHLLQDEEVQELLMKKMRELGVVTP